MSESSQPETADDQVISLLNSGAELFHEIKKEEEKVAALKRKLAMIQAKIGELWKQTGQESSRVSTPAGRCTVYLQEQYIASIEKDHEEDVIQWLQQNGFGDLVKNAVSKKDLTDFVREREEKGEEVPPHVTIYRPNNVRFRRLS